VANRVEQHSASERLADSCDSPVFCEQFRGRPWRGLSVAYEQVTSDCEWRARPRLMSPHPPHGSASTAAAAVRRSPCAAVAELLPPPAASFVSVTCLIGSAQNPSPCSRVSRSIINICKYLPTGHTNTKINDCGSESYHINSH